MFLIGSGVGSIFTGPFSETFGRLPVYLGSVFFLAIFVMATALSPNIGAQLVFRFFVGIFGCAPLTCAGGTISDLWTPVEKIWSFTLLGLLAFGGPMIVSHHSNRYSELPNTLTRVLSLARSCTPTAFHLGDGWTGLHSSLSA